MQENMYSNRIKQIFSRWESSDEATFDFDLFQAAFRNMYHVTNQLKLRSFQYRLLYKQIVLNDKLYKWRIKSNNICTRCNDDTKEDLYHFLWDCICTKRVWLWVEQIFQEIDPNTEYVLNYNTIILNLCTQRPGHIFNLCYY